MSSSGPSAERIAAEIRRQSIIENLKFEKPAVYKKYITRKNRQNFILVSIFIFSFFLLYLLFEGNRFNRNDGPFFMISVLFSGILALIIVACASFFTSRVFRTEDTIDKHDNLMRVLTLKREQMVQEMSNKISDIEASHLGDIIINSPGATIFKDSVFTNSFNNLKQKDPQLAEALKTVAGHVEHSKNKDAVEAFENFTEELEREKPKSSKLSAFWEQLIKILPHIAVIGSAASTITKIFIK